jgi:SAM-dependent methyltransferase
VKYLEPITYVCDMTAIPLPSGCLDAILCTEVIEHVVDPMAVLREFSRLLKPGGRLLLTAPSASQLHMEPWHFYGGFTAQWYRHWLPITGFEVKSVTPVGGPGHLAVYFLQDLYASLRSQEHRKPPFARLVSKFNRALLKPWVHWLLPGPLRRIDKCLDTAELGSGFMVASVRRSKET